MSEWSDYSFSKVVDHAPEASSYVLHACRNDVTGTIIACDTGFVLRSTDAEIWLSVQDFGGVAEISDPILGTGQDTPVRAICIDGVFFVMAEIGANRRLYQSTDDGLTFTLLHESTSSYVPNQTITDIRLVSDRHVANGYFYVRNSDGTVVRTTDMVTWETTTLSGHVRGVAYGATKWLVAAGSSHYASSDGTTFYLTLADTAYGDYAIGNALWSPAFSKFFIINANETTGYVASSPDADTWVVHTDAQMDPTSLGGGYPPGGIVPWKVATAIVEVPNGIFITGPSYVRLSYEQMPTTFTNMYYVVQENKFFAIQSPSCKSAFEYEGGVFFTHWRYSGLLTINYGGDPVPEPVLDFWTGFNLTYEIP